MRRNLNLITFYGFYRKLPITIRMSNSKTNKNEIDDIFDIFSTSQNHMLHPDVLGNVLRILGRVPTEHELKELCQKYSHENLISLEDVKTILNETFVVEKNRDIKKWVSFLNHNEKISLPELRFVLTNYGEKLDASEIGHLFQAFLNLNPAGIVNQDTLVEYLENLY
ncbi:hypothetical protein HZS_4935 [Henneguya salminicola]|nr:hypothetical protein HZS_4935 [Henneguya salminicola]